MKAIFITLPIIAILFLASCATEPKDVLVDDPKAKDVIDKLCAGELKYHECNHLRDEFKDVISSSELGNEGRAYIAKKYGAKYENLTIGDLMDYIAPGHKIK